MNRRGFLKGLVAACSALTIPGLWPSKKAPPAPRDLTEIPQYGSGPGFRSFHLGRQLGKSHVQFMRLRWEMTQPKNAGKTYTRLLAAVSEPKRETPAVRAWLDDCERKLWTEIGRVA